jgi:hypothetical protein
MASELLEYEDEDDPNDTALAGTKRVNHRSTAQ